MKFLKNYTWIKRWKLPCVFFKMDELEEDDVRGICLLHTFEGIEGH